MPLTTDWRVKLLGYDFTAKAEWGVDIEETLGQPATARFRLQDRFMGSGWFQDLDPGNVGFTLSEIDTLIELDGATDPMFRGKVLRAEVDLPVGHPYRIFDVACTDYQREVFDRRIIGAPTGDIWAGPDSDNNYVPVDPGALFDAGPVATHVARVFDDYAAVPAFVGTIDAVTFVRDYGNIEGAPLLANKARARQVLEWLAGQVGGNLQYWMDPSLRVHWQVIPRWFEQETPEFFGALGLPATTDPMEPAPVDLDNDNPDGVASVGFRGLKYGFDYGNILHQHYVVGGTGYKYNGGLVDKGGTGWVVFGAESAPVKNIAQDVLDVPSSVDVASKLSSALRAEQAVAQGVLRGTAIVGNERHHPDGFHVGQSIKITDARMGELSGRYYCIQRVRTQLIPFTNWRIYHLEWGDAPIARASSRRPLALEEAPDAGRLWEIAGRVGNPLPGSTITVVGQLVDDKGQPRRVAMVNVELELHVWDDTGAPVVGVGSLSSTNVTTDTMGRWQTDMTVGTQPGYSYCVDEAGSGSCSIGVVP